MKTRWFLSLLVILCGLVTGGAQAQVTTNLDPTQYYLATTQSLSLDPHGGFCTGQFCLDPAAGIPLSYFATSSSVTSQFNSLSSQVTSMGTLFTGQLNALNSRVSSQFAKASQGIAVTAAMGDAIPNPGDRFAVRFNAAEFDSQAAGAVSFSYAFADNARASLNLGQARSTTIVSGGVTLSFH